MVALVTGYRGFLGSHVLAELRGHGYEAVGAGRPELELTSGRFASLARETRPSLVIHCGGPASVPASVEDPEGDRAATLDTLAAVLQTIGGARLVLVSSAAVYGQPEQLPVGEDAPLAPVSPYGRHRVEAEALARELGGPVAIARVFSAYGEGLRRQVLWDVARRALAGGPVELSGSGRETRDFVHARDVARAIRTLVEGAAFTGEAYNVGTGVETRIAELAELLTRELGGGEVRFSGAPRPGDPERWRADISRLRALGFEPSVRIEDGAAAYARWAREQT